MLATTSGAGIHGTAYATAPYAATKAAQLSIMESLYGQVRDEGLDLHVGVVVPPLTRTNLAGDDLSIWEHVAAGLAAHGMPAAVIEPEAVAALVRRRASSGARSGSKPTPSRTPACTTVGTAPTSNASTRSSAPRPTR